MASLKDYTTICNSAPSELLATSPCATGTASWRAMWESIRHNLDLLDEFFAAHADRFDWHRPKAGPIAFPRLTGGAAAAPYCEQLVEQAGVLLLPGDLIDPAYASHFRIGFGRRNMPDALEQLSGVLAVL